MNALLALTKMTPFMCVYSAGESAAFEQNRLSWLALTATEMKLNLKIPSHDDIMGDEDEELTLENILMWFLV